MYGSFQGPQMVVTTADPSIEPCKERKSEIKLWLTYIVFAIGKSYV